MSLTFKRNKTTGTLQAAYAGSVRVGYVESSATDRWLWSLNTIQPQGGRASGIAETEETAKAVLTKAWLVWVSAAGLKEQP